MLAASQDKYAYFNSELRFDQLKQNRFRKDSIHLGLFPYHTNDIQALHKRKQESDNGLWNKDFSVNESISIFPLAELENGFDPSSKKQLVLNNNIGVGFEWKHKRWYANANYLFGFWQGADYLNDLADSAQIIRGNGYAHKNGSNFLSHLAFGKLRFSPNHFFNLELGNGSHFLGFGHRSLMVSDNATPYPYFKIDTKVWRFRYSNIYSWMLDITQSNGFRKDYVNKFTTSHYLEYNVTRSWTIGLFETIIWQGKDTLLNRGFDVNYLNPIIFYRPVEFAQGSADNAILGLNSLIKITDNHHLYSQFVIDEFLLSAISADIEHLFNKADTSIEYGWWANKYAFQLGYKYFNVAGIDGLDFQTEMNLVRPFTFAHGSTFQNYAHHNQSIAHPLGANFYEWINYVRYQTEKWRISTQFVWSNYGTDKDGISYGGNLYQPYQNRVGSFYHSIGQGVKNVLLYNDLKFTYIINPNINLELDLGYRHRSNTTKNDQQMSNLVYFSIRTKLWNRYTDY